MLLKGTEPLILKLQVASQKSVLRPSMIVWQSEVPVQLCFLQSFMSQSGSIEIIGRCPTSSYSKAVYVLPLYCFIMTPGK